MKFGSLLSVIAVASFVVASPLKERLFYIEPAISVSQAQVAPLITCPAGLPGTKAGGIVLLIHGTGSTGAESWANGPYVKTLPTTGRGYDSCYIDLPNRTLSDAQVTAEYVVAAVRYLATKSTTGKVSLIGHSQGAGLNVPWAFEWFPSTQRLVTTFISLAGDFHGTAEGALLCSPLTTCSPSVKQQTVGSNYLYAQNNPLPGSAARASSVPTTSIFTRYDDVIQPEGPTNAVATSYLPGASNFALQDADVCGPTHLADHFTMVIDSAAFGLAKAALEHPGAPASLANFDKAYCLYLVEAPTQVFTSVPADLQSAFNDAIAVGSGEFFGVRVEPKLKQYVCNRGFAPPGYSCA